jgi:hypothetical protein
MPSSTSWNYSIFRNTLLGHDSWKSFQQNFNFKVILQLLLTSTWRTCHSLWKEVTARLFPPHVDVTQKLRVPSVALFTHQNSWYDVLDLDTGWRCLLKESFPVSNISCIKFVCPVTGTTLTWVMSGKRGDTSKHLARDKNHIQMYTANQNDDKRYRTANGRIHDVFYRLYPATL